jgi:hypothetical protein
VSEYDHCLNNTSAKKKICVGIILGHLWLRGKINMIIVLILKLLANQRKLSTKQMPHVVMSFLRLPRDLHVFCFAYGILTVFIIQSM